MIPFMTSWDLLNWFIKSYMQIKTDADCTELFIKSRDYSDEIMEAEIKGDNSTMRIVFMREN